MSTLDAKPRLTSLAPQLLVGDLARSVSYYRKLGFTFGEPWDGVLRHRGAGRAGDPSEGSARERCRTPAPARARDLDAAAGVDGIEAFYERLVANGVTILRPLAATAWGTKDFYVEDPDGNVIAFGGRPSESGAAAGRPRA